MPIYYLERKTGEKKEEIVAGGKYLNWLYESKSGFPIVTLVKRKLFSVIYGMLQDTVFSRKKIKNFITSLEIDMTEAKIEDPLCYLSFNDFFSRELKTQSRTIDPDPRVLVSPADGRVLAWENIDANRLIQVKGSTYSLEALLRSQDLARKYDQGTCVVIRLCPADYHRFHFPAAGIPSAAQSINGSYYSVNPVALKKVPRIYCENKRELTIFRTEHFGEIILLEVGATFVGSIIQTYTPGQQVAKGLEKGYFKFGGSTVIMLIEKSWLAIDQDILLNTSDGLETKISMGERIGIGLQIL